MSTHFRHAAIALALVAGAGAAEAQTVITREISTQPVETIVERGPAGTVISRRPLDMTVPRAPVTLSGETTATAPVETISQRETVGASTVSTAPSTNAPRRAAVHRIVTRPPVHARSRISSRSRVGSERTSATTTQRTSAAPRVSATPRVSTSSVQRRAGIRVGTAPARQAITRMSTSRTRQVAPVVAPALTAIQRQAIYRTIVENRVVPRTVVAAPAAPLPLYGAPAPLYGTTAPLYGAPTYAVPAGAPVVNEEVVTERVIIPAAPAPVYERPVVSAPRVTETVGAASAVTERVVTTPAMIIIGSRLPATVPLYAVPASLAVQIPAIRPYRYALLDGRLFLVNPSGIVVEEIEQ